MARFKITYPTETEEVEADSYAEVKSWIVFYDEDSLGMSVEKLRIKSAGIRRIERVDN